VEPIFAGLKTAVSALVALEPAVGLKTAVAAAVVVAEEPALAGPTRVGLAAVEDPRRLAMLKAAAVRFMTKKRF